VLNSIPYSYSRCSFEPSSNAVAWDSVGAYFVSVRAGIITLVSDVGIKPRVVAYGLL
jgi:hypothetical protein